MTILEILRTRKEEIIEKTIELLPTALSGDRANRTFFFKVDEETDELKVDYICYLGRQKLSDNCFYTILDYETPDPEEFGYDDFQEMDFYACGFAEQIEYFIDNKIGALEAFEATTRRTKKEALRK